MTYSAEVLADAPLLYAKLDDTSGTTAADSSGNSRPLTVNGAVTLGAAPLFAGSTNAFDLAGSSGAFLSAVYDAAWMPLNSAAFTVEMWINADSLSGIRGLAGRDGSTRGWEWYISGNKLVLDVPFVSATSGTRTGSTTLATGTNYHVVLTYDGTTLIQYVNGVQDSTAVTTMLDPANRLTVGACAGGATNGSSFLFDGRIDDFAYYNTALSATRVAAHYAAGTASPNAAAGTASLSLSASGATAATSGGTASLSLSASSAGTTASAAGTASLSLSAAGALIPPTPAAGAASLALSGAGGASGSPAGAASLNLVATGAALAALAASGTATLTLTASGSAVMSTGGTATLTLSAVGVAAVLYLTDTANGFNGRTRGARATVTITRPLAPLPPGRTFGVRYDKAIAYPTPDMVDGRPT